MTTTTRSWLKRGIATFVAGALCITLASCADTSSALSVDGENIPAGVYLLNQIVALNEAQATEDFDTEKEWKNTIEDKPMADWVTTRTKELALSYAEIEFMYEEKGMTLSEEDLETIEYQVTSSWPSYEEAYNKIGISEKSYEKFIASSIKKQQLFEAYYGADGTEPVTDATLLEHFQSDYAQIDMIPFSTYDSENAKAMEDEQKKEVEAKANEYLERVKAGEDITALYDEATETKAEDHVTEGDLHSHTLTIKKETPTYSISEQLNAAVFEMATAGGDPVVLNDDNGYYVIKRLEITEDNMTETTRLGLLQDLKSESFDEMIEQAAEKREVEYNDAAIRAFKPQKLTEK